MDKPNRADFVVACRMKRVGLIRNPRSRGNRGPANGFTSRAQEWLGPCFVEVASPHDMREVLADFERRGVELLIVDGGDGTLHNALSVLPPAWEMQPPRMAIMASGNTNLVAGDVGSGVRGVKGLRSLIDFAQQGADDPRRLRTRACLELHWTDNVRPVARGMFFGAAAFTRGTDLAHGRLRSSGIFHTPEVLIAVAVSLAQSMRKASRERWLAGDAIEVAVDGQPNASGKNRFLFLATTLNKIMAGIWPFWNDAGASLRYLEIDAEPKRLGSASFSLLRGRAPQWLKDAEDYRSGGAFRIDLKLSERFVLDGEVFEPGPSGKVTLGTGPRLEFVVL